MKKPIEPQKRVEVFGQKIFYFNHSSPKISLKYFLSQIKEVAPKNAKDFTLSIHEEFDEMDGDTISCSILVEWKYKIKNAHYVSEMTRYQKKLSKWKKKNVKS